MSYKLILTETRDSVCIITMNRPDVMNAWTPQMCVEMLQAIENANNDDDILAIVLTGAGRAFCAGADIRAVFKTRADGKKKSTSNEDERANTWVDQVRGSKPIVAAVNGFAVGIGMSQILSMDYLIASEDAKLSMRFIKMGLVPELASSHYLTKRLGFGRASEILLSGRIVEADEALHMGLVDMVTSADTLIATAIEIARGMGNNPLAAIRLTKGLLDANASETDMVKAQKREAAALQKCYKSNEHKEAINAFIEKREPDFKSARKR